MSFLTDYIDKLRNWIDDEDISDSVITDWIRDGEERINNELRTDIQIERTEATLNDDCVVLPPDWLEHVYVRMVNGRPFDFITPHDYWEMKYGPPSGSLVPQPDPYGGAVYPAPGRKQLYTTIGRTLFVYPPINPDLLVKVELAYYRSLVPLGDNKDAVFDRYPTIYRHAALTAGAPYLIEDERINVWGALATAAIQKANDAHVKGRWSGSPLPQLIRSFG